MIQVTAQTRVLLCMQFIDFRKGIDGLAAVCRNHLDMDPMSGAVFVFRNRTGTSLRLLFYDGQGFWLCAKRLSKGTFLWWPSSSEGGVSSPIPARDLQTLLWNGDPAAARFSKEWRKI